MRLLALCVVAVERPCDSYLMFHGHPRKGSLFACVAFMCKSFLLDSKGNFYT